MGWELIWIVFAVALAACALGFIRFVYFMSLSYGLAAVGGSAAIIIIFAVKGGLGVVPAILLALIIIYGLRLAIPVAAREFKGAARKKTLKEGSGAERPVAVPVLIVMWLLLAALYTLQLSPVFYRLYNGSVDVVFAVIGAVISFAGLLIAILADRQKASQKKERPDLPATGGLYRMCRCPDYFGEILFWTGIFVTGWGALVGAGQWIFAVIAWVAVILVMFGGAKRLEMRQNRTYGANPEYREYVKKTPIIIPLLPIYTLNRKKEEKK